VLLASGFQEHLTFVKALTESHGNTSCSISYNILNGIQAFVSGLAPKYATVYKKNHLIIVHANANMQSFIIFDELHA